MRNIRNVVIFRNNVKVFEMPIGGRNFIIKWNDSEPLDETAWYYARFQAEDEEGRGEGVGCNGIGGDDGGAEHSGGWVAAAGVDDVAVALACKLKELLVLAGAGEGVVSELFAE